MKEDTREITPELLSEFFDYDHMSGIFLLKERKQKWFLLEGACKGWNERFANKKTGTTNVNGYTVLSVFHKQVTAHRAAWAIFYGRFPENEIDHINGDRSDNRILNLRDVDRVQNGKNLCLYPNNTSGCSGVYKNKAANTWYAQIKKKGKNTHLGTFQTKEDAIAARKKAEAELGYHRNHGRR